MASRQGCIRAALTAALLVALLLPAAAAAGPQWLAPDTLGPAAAGPDVTTDTTGNSAAAWVANGHVLVAERPRGGEWGAPHDLDPAGTAETQSPKIAAPSAGELVVLWVDGGHVQAARRAPGGAWSAATAISTTCCPALHDLVAGAGGTAIGYWTSNEGSPETAAKPPGSAGWEAARTLPEGTADSRLAVADDGSAEVATPASCGDPVAIPCIITSHRSPGRPWARDPAGPAVTGHVTGLALVARADRGFALVWGEDGLGGVRGRSQTPDGHVASADRGPGSAGAWDGDPATVSQLTGAAPGCISAGSGCIDLAIAGDGTLAAVWQQGDGSLDATDQIASARRAAGGSWSSPETVESVIARDAFPRAAFTGNGIPVAVWRVGSGGPGTAIRGAHRDARAGWVPEPLDAPATQDVPVEFEDVVGDGEGNAVTGWRDQDGVGVAGFDGAGPRFSAFSISSVRTANEPVRFTAAADDNWSGPPAFSWLFGDGGSASGPDVTHGYTNAGEYPATATATDGAGNASSQSGRVTITAAPKPCGSTDRDGDGIFDGCDTSDGAQAPTPFRTVNATVVSGEVFVKRPAGAARAAAGAKPPKGFARLQGAETIPTGSTLDTAAGTVLLRSAKDTRRHVQRGRFSGGRFVIGQVRKPRTRSGRRSTGLITELRLTGSSFRRACATAKLATVSRRRSRKRVRRLFGDGKGSFRTRGRNAAATVRGTRWGTQDRCDGTLVIVQRGRVSVRDLVRHRTVLVRAGHAYLARRRG